MKKFITVMFLLLLLVPAQVFAHSKMTSSTPSNNDVLSQSPEFISMEFNTDIASLSTFILENEHGETIDVQDIKVDRHILSGIPVSPLTTSSYSAKWTIIGADGHTVDGSFSFKVNVPEIEPTPSTEPTVTEQPPATPEPTLEPTLEGNDTSVETNTSETSTGSKVVSFVLIAIIIGLAVIYATRRTKKQ